MTPTELTYYLANVLTFTTKESLSGSQESIMESICRDLQIEKNRIIEAAQLAGQEEYRLTPVGRYSERVKNLEDILLISMAEGYLDDEIKNTMLGFAKDLGISQTQMRIIAQEAKARFQFEKMTLECPACHAQISANSKYCPECGVKQQKLAVGRLPAPGTDKLIGYSIPARGICIEFGNVETRDETVALAREGRQFRSRLQGDQYWFIVTWPVERISEAIPLAIKLHKHPDKRVYIDGKLSSWEDVFGFIPCLLQRQEAYQSDEHCFGLSEGRLNIWGCKQARMDWSDKADWLNFGEFEGNTVFAFDKSKIQHHLEKNLHKYRFCPHLNWKSVENALQQFPARAVVNDKSEWQYQESDGEIMPNTMKITEKVSDEYGAPTRTRYITGIQSTGYSEARKVIEHVFPAAQIRRLLR